jgi:Skp family chaperone for outer membrane proteins
LQGDLKIQQGKLEAPLKAKMVRVVQKLGRDGGFTVILSRDTPGLIYRRERLDVTDDVVARFNSQE